MYENNRRAFSNKVTEAFFQGAAVEEVNFDDNQ